MQSRSQRHQLRKALFLNGFDPLPNKRKLCVMEDWSRVPITEDLLTSDPYKKYTSTGIRCGEVIALDIDIDDPELLEDFIEHVFDHMPADFEGSDFVRIGRAPREMWIFATDDKIGKHTTGKFGRGFDEETGEYAEVYQLEILGHGSQFGAYGKHSKDIEYTWPDSSLEDHGIDELPLITLEQCKLLIEVATKFFQERDFERVSTGLNQTGGFDHVYDLEQDMVVTTRDHGNLTIEQITKILSSRPDESWRCCMDFIREDTEADTTGLISYLDGDITITDFATGMTHFPAEHNIDNIISDIREYLEVKGKEVQAKKVERIVAEEMDPTDDFEDSLIKALDRYVYVDRDDRIVDKYKPSILLTPKGFKNKLAPYNQEDVGAKGAVRKTYLSTVWLEHSARLTAQDVFFRPDQPPLLYREGSELFVNTYTPVQFPDAGGDASVGFRFLEHLLPDREEREYFIRWLSYKLQHLESRGPAIVMVADNIYGTGRGTLAKLIRRMLGGNYVGTVDFKTLTGATHQGQYNDWQEQNLFVTVDEAKENKGNAWKASANAYETLKEVVEVGESPVLIKRKTISNSLTRVFFSLMIFTNHTDALVIPEDDRRLAVLENGEKLSKEFSDEVHDWMENPRNVGAFVEEIMAYDLADYSPEAAPPMTAIKREMVNHSQSDLDTLLDDFIEQCEGDVACLPQFESYIAERQQTDELHLPDNWERTAVTIFKKKTRSPKNNLIRIGKRQYRYRFLRNYRAVAKFNSKRLKAEIEKNGYLMEGYNPSGMSNVVSMATKKKQL